MDKLKKMKEQLICCVQSQLTNIDSVNTEELGEVIDMIKDLSKTMYYCTITEAMEEKEKESEHKEHYRYYPKEKTYPDYYRDIDREYGRMYYDGNKYPFYSDRIDNDYSDGGYKSNDRMKRDSREGISPLSRKMYMESKEMHKDKAVLMKELEDYVQELSKDITDMISDATVEERQMLKQKLTTLVSKIEI